MDIVKKNILSVICGVVALLALLLYFWPLGAVRAQQQKLLDERVNVQTRMQDVLTRSRTLPQADLGGAGEAQELDVFPTQKVITWGQDLKQKIADESAGIVKAAVAMNKHEPLVAGALPKAAKMADFAFRDRYPQAVDAIPKLLQAGSPPTPEEVAEAISQAQDRGGSIATGAPGAGVSDETLKEQQELLRSLAASKAQKILVYMEPEVIARSAQIAPSGAPPTPTAIWYAQLNLWVQTDIVQAIYEINKPSGNVINAPVKRVEEIQILGYRTATGMVGETGAGGSPMGMGGMPMGMGGPMGPGGPMGMGGPMGGPGGATGAPAAGPDVPSYTLSATGRVCNSVYDVVPFKLVLHVEVDRLPLVLQSLGRNRFMTAYDVSLKSLDSVVLQMSDNVFYGSKPVVEATISAEALLLRDWTVPLMPEDVKRQLGVSEPGATGAAGASNPE